MVVRIYTGGDMYNRLVHCIIEMRNECLHRDNLWFVTATSMDIFIAVVCVQGFKTNMLQWTPTSREYTLTHCQLPLWALLNCMQTGLDYPTSVWVSPDYLCTVQLQLGTSLHSQYCVWAQEWDKESMLHLVPVWPAVCVTFFCCGFEIVTCSCFV